VHVGTALRFDRDGRMHQERVRSFEPPTRREILDTLAFARAQLRTTRPEPACLRDHSAHGLTRKIGLNLDAPVPTCMSHINAARLVERFARKPARALKVLTSLPSDGERARVVAQLDVRLAGRLAEHAEGKLGQLLHVRSRHRGTVYELNLG
jgi:hypothetical protein